MFKVAANDLDAYFSFDPQRKSDLKALDGLIRKAAPSLECYFHGGTPAGSAGMRIKMIGYGRLRYCTQSGKSVAWPVIGVALQRNYISVYLSITVEGRPIMDRYREKLGEMRSGRNNFSFDRYEELKSEEVARMMAQTARAFAADPDNPVRYREGS